MQRHIGIIAGLCASTLLLPGCATNAIRITAAGEVQNQSRAAVTAAGRYFDAIEQRRREAAAALVASDPTCLPVTPIRIQVPSGPDTTPGASLCFDGADPLPGYTAFDIDIGTSPRSVLEPRIALLAAITDYADALAIILESPKADISAEIALFADQLDRVARFTNLVAGTDLPDVNAAIGSQQGQGLVELIVFSDELEREARQTGDVRALVLARGDVVDRALSWLAFEVETWGRGAARSADDLYANALFRTYLRNRTDLTADKREQLAARIFAAREAAVQGPARAAEVTEAINLTAKAQTGLRDALAGRLSAKQRRAAARINLDRITRALGLIVSIVSPV